MNIQRTIAIICLTGPFVAACGRQDAVMSTAAGDAGLLSNSVPSALFQAFDAGVREESPTIGRALLTPAQPRLIALDSAGVCVAEGNTAFCEYNAGLERVHESQHSFASPLSSIAIGKGADVGLCGLTPTSASCGALDSSEDEQLPTVSFESEARLISGFVGEACRLGGATGSTLRCGGLVKEHVSDVSLAGAMLCFIQSGTPHCLFMGNGQTYEEYSSLGAIEGLRGVRSVVAMSGERGCVLTADHSIRCAAFSVIHAPVPTIPSDVPPVRQIAATWAHVCALTDQDVRCFGPDKDRPQLAGRPHAIMSGGSDRVCGVYDDHVACSGGSFPANFTGATPSVLLDDHRGGVLARFGSQWKLFKDSTTWAPGIMQDLNTGGEWREVAMGGWFSCGIHETKGVVCRSDQSGNSLTTGTPTDLVNPRQLGMGHTIACAITDDGTRCWPMDKGDTHDGVVAGITVPDAIKGRVPDQLAVSKVGYGACALMNDSDRSVHCWGDIPAAPAGLSKTRRIATGWGSACALHAQGVTCWAKDSHALEAVQVPSSLALDSTVGDIWAGEHHYCAATRRGLICFGNDQFGQSRVPTDLAKDASRVKSMTLSEQFSCAMLDTDKAVRCWGGTFRPETPQNKRHPFALVNAARQAPFELRSSIGDVIDDLAGTVYAEKKRFLKRASEILSSLPRHVSRDHLEGAVALYGMEAFLRTIDNDLTVQSIKGPMDDAALTLGRTLDAGSLSRIPRRDENVALALRLTIAAFQSAKSSVTIASQYECEAVVNELSSLLAVAPGVSIDPAEAAAIIARHPNVLNELEGSPRLRPFARLIGTYGVWLGSR